MDCPGNPDRCGHERNSAICISAGVAAGRGVLRAQRAVVLHRDAPVWAASCPTGGSRIRACDIRNGAVSCGVRVRGCVDRALQRHSRMCCRAVPVGSDGIRDDASACHRISVEPARICRGGKSCLRAVDGDHRNFRIIVAGGVLQRAHRVGSARIPQWQNARSSLVLGEDCRADCDRTGGAGICSAGHGGSCGAPGPDEFPRCDELSRELDANARSRNGRPCADQH